MINHNLVQILLDEGANLFCNGGIINTVQLLQDKLGISKKESYEILLECRICEKDKTYIESEIKRCYPDRKAISEEYDYIIANMHHGTSYLGKSDKEIEHHESIIAWLKARQLEFSI